MLLPVIFPILFYTGFYLVKPQHGSLKFFVHRCHLKPSHQSIQIHRFWVFNYIWDNMLFCSVLCVRLISKMTVSSLRRASA